MPFEPGEVLQLAPDIQRAYDAVVRPNAILPIPKYFMDHWLPLLGTSRAWVTLSFRQVAFVSRSGNLEVPVRTTLRKLGRWCGLSHVRVHQVLKNPGHLTWFVRNLEGDLAERRTPRSEPPTYMVRSDIPLTPKDQARLTLWLEERSPIDDLDWVHALEEAIEARESDLPKDHPLPEISLTVQQMVYAQRGDDTPLPPSLDEACTELHSRWVQPERVTLATHYFMVRWLPDLSPGLGWLVLYLRSRTYLQEDLQVGQVWVSGGWKGIAAALGVSRKSLSRWLRSDTAKLFFKRRENAEDLTNRRNILLYVRMSEPIHPNDQERYESLLKGQDLTSPISLDRQDLTRLSTEQGQSLTSCGKRSTDLSRNLTDPGQELPIGAQNLTTDAPKLNKIGTNLNALSPSKYTSKIKLQELIQPPATNTQTDQATHFVVDVKFEWDIDQMLLRSGVGKGRREKLLMSPLVEKFAFVGWMLFALTIPKIEYPTLFALKRVGEGMPPDAYMKLAQISLEDISDILTGRSEEKPRGLEKEVVDLRKGKAYLRLKELGAISSVFAAKAEERFDRIQAGSETSGGSDQSIRVQDKAGLKVWHAARGQLQIELSKAIYDTWVRDVELSEFDGDELVLGAANNYARDWLTDRLKSTVERIVTGILGKEIDVRFVVYDDMDG